MIEVTLDEFLIADGVFSRIQSLSPLPFFATIPAVELDQLLKIRFGERLVFEKFLKVSLETIALFIVSEYSNKWSNILATLSADFKNGSERFLSENTDNKVTSLGSNVLENKVSAFNSDELVIDKSDSNTSSNDTDSIVTKNTTEKLTSYVTVYNNLSLTQKLNIINTVIYDVAKHLTLDIYK